MDKAKKTSSIWARIVLVVILLVIGAIYAVNISKEYPKKTAYDSAVSAMRQGDYEAAVPLFKALGEYQNAVPYMYYCEAQVYAGNGDYRKADTSLFRMTWKRKLADDDYPSGYDDLSKVVSAESAKLYEEDRRREKEAYEKRVREGIPFVGMSEKDISNTILGAPSPKIEHNSEWVKGVRESANLYRWIVDNKRIFSARCLDGKVVGVWDFRDNPWLESTPRPASGKKKAAYSADEDDDDYGIRDYADPEDFYEDYYDEFDSYEEAEDYYYDHGGW